MGTHEGNNQSVINALHPQNAVGKVQEKVRCTHWTWHHLPPQRCIQPCHDRWVAGVSLCTTAGFFFAHQ